MWTCDKIEHFRITSGFLGSESKPREHSPLFAKFSDVILKQSAQYQQREVSQLGLAFQEKALGIFSPRIHVR